MNNLSVSNQTKNSEIAIIGMAGRFPGAKDINTFWHNLRDGVESISIFSEGELESSVINPVLVNNPNYVKAGAVLEGIELFDAPFFGFNAKEAEIMDPQHRLFLECAWEVIESAGYNTETYEGAVGVYAGVGISNYLLFNLYPNQDLLKSVGSFQVLLGNDKDFLPTQASYKLNLKGPSINIQTACSTSLVAVHIACQSLQSGECDIALAGGVSVRVPQKSGYLYQEGGIHSPDGHCRAFDARAQGTVHGNGIGIVLLKRLSDALADGDCIHAIIKGSAINNDGSLKVGYTAPSVDSQEAVISEAQAIAAIEPDTVTYIEAHGTGTSIGDPIEIMALTQAFRAGTEAKGFCAIGSLKTNVGHLDAAAGVAGLIKTVLALKHKLLPPSLHFQEPNPKIDFASSPFYVNTSLSEWKTNENPRRAGVSSFGIGGTNAHVVLEEAPVLEASGESRPWHLLVLSAKTDSALDRATLNLSRHLQQHPELNLADVAYTYQVGRRVFNYRRMLVCQNLDDSAIALSTLEPKRVFTSYQESKERPVAFMFAGQGAQYVNMGLDLYQSEPTFRQQVDLCSQLLEPHLGIDLRHVLYPSEEAAVQQLQQTAITQPALFVIEYALAKLWMEWGVRPQAMLGHSIGEYVAACLSGVFSLEDALALVAARGHLMQKLPGGTMLAVPLSEQEVRSLLSHQLSLAAINGPSLCVVSGATDAVEQLEGQLTKQGIDCRRLRTSHAFHSEMMNPILEPFALTVKKVNLQPPQIPFISNVTGTWITAAEATESSYWVKHLRSCVRFADGLHELFKQPEQILLEIGSGQTLGNLARQHPDKSDGQIVLSSLRHPHGVQSKPVGDEEDKGDKGENVLRINATSYNVQEVSPRQSQPSTYEYTQSDVAVLLTTLGQLWLSGVQVDWSRYYTHERRYRIPLPTYPFERQRYWIEPQKHTDTVTSHPVSLYKKPDIADWFYIPSWKRSIPLLETQLAASVQKEDMAGQKLCWLVFIDACGLGAQLVKQLEQNGQDVTAVMVGEQFTKHRENLYEINPRQRNHYNELFQELAALDKVPQTIVHLWSVTERGNREQGTGNSIELFEKSQDLGFYSLLFLAQALGEQNLTAPLEIGVVSNNLQGVTGFEVLYPEKATVLGPCKVIPQEYPYITCRNIDIDSLELETESEERLSNYILSELTAKSSDSVVAYRGRHRWVQTFEPIRLEEPAQGKQRLRDKGVYLITGGLGGIGFVLAEYLAKTVQARLILIGRSAFPAKDEWEQWLATHDEQDHVSCKIRKVQALETMAVEVMVKSADVTNLEQMQAVISQASERFGEIHGVIHSAGIAGGGMIQLKTPETVESVFAPKVRGVQVLDAIFKNTKLDFFVLCSSLSSILGGFGQVDYCAANSFLDAFAHSNTDTKGIFTVSINWDTWQEGGMAVNTSMPLDLKRLRVENLNRGILSKEGADVFSRILRNPLAQFIISTQNLQATIEQNQAVAVSSVLEELEQIRLSESKHPRPHLQNSYVAPRNDAEQTIALIWQELLGIEPLGVYDNFFEVGGHSLLATQLLSQLRSAFQVELPLSRFFEATTIAELAELIGEHKAELDILPQRPKQNYAPLSFAQARLWFLEQLEPSNPFYNLFSALRLSGHLKLGVLEESLNQIICRHDALRTNFTTQDGQPVQVIAPSLSLRLPVVDLRSLPEVHREVELRRLATLQAKLPFDLTQDLLLRITLLRLDESEHVMLLTMHHIISDGWSIEILIQELAALYESLSRGQPSPLPKLPIQYRDFAVWEQQWLQGKVLAAHLAYWKQQLRGPLPVLKLPTDRPRSAVQSFHGATQAFCLSPELTEALKALSRQEGVTLFMTLLAAFQTLLHRYTKQDDIIIGTDVANRNRAETRSLIGFFINILVLRTDLSGNPSFRELLSRVRQVALGAYAHQDLPFSKLVEALRPERKTSYTPLFQVLFVFQNAPPAIELPGLKLSLLLLETDNKTVKFDLVLFLTETEQGLIGTWNYSTDLFEATTIASLSSHFQTLLDSIVTQPDARLSNLDILTEAQKRQQATEKQERTISKHKRFIKVEPKTFNFSKEKLVKTEILPSGETLPLVLKPDFKDIDIIDWAHNSREFIETKLLHHGALLWRGFDLESVSDFENLAEAICPELFSEYGDLPREGVGGKVYGSTPYPADEAILFHNESSHLHCWPLKIWFFCVQPASQGGETPIVDCRKVYQLLDPKLRSRFEQKQLMYVRNYTPGLDVSWQEFFHTKDKAVVENYCRKAATEFEWKPGNGLRTRKVAQAIAKHPKTGDLTFFNQIQLHHISCLEPAVRESLLSLFGEDNLPRNVYYGDGSPIENSVIQEILAVYQEATISFPWQQGDVLMLDNMLTAHGRNPYSGSRKIVVAIGEMCASEELKYKGTEKAHAN